MYKNTDIRNFYFENEIGVRIDCQKVNGSLFLYDPTGLGFEDEYTYEAVGDTYILNSKTAKQIPITGNLEFYDMTYDEYRNFVDFIIKASKLKLIYIPKYSYRKEFYRDIDFASIQKMDEDDFNVLTCPISLNPKSLWYSPDVIVFKITDSDEGDVRWDFQWDSRFKTYDIRRIIFENNGHVEAPIKLKMDGLVINPSISIYEDGVLVKNLIINITVNSNEQLLFSTLDNDLYVFLKKSDGTLVNLFNELSLQNDNFFKLRKGISEISLAADNDIGSAELTIYVEYKAV